jgi:glycyl-tRNA synthetase
VQLPFGVGQIGKSFRNEVTTGQFIFRTLEFEQGEIEYFFDPEQTNWQELMEQWKQRMWQFVTETLGINPENLRWRKHTDKERSHYSLDTYDLEYRYPFGWKELWGIAYRTDYDLQQHIKHSGEKLEFFNSVTNKKVVPHVIEPAVGINRLFLMILCDAYQEDAERQRTVLHLKQQVSPVEVAVFPLVKNKSEIVNKANQVFVQLVEAGKRVVWDERGNIGKRYLSHDEIGTPWCVTIDYQTLEDDTVTIRNRETTEQTRVRITELPAELG